MKTVDVRGVQFNVLDEGSGPPLLLVHGFPLNHTMWRHQIEFFAPRFRVIAPDLRSFGRSGGVPAGGAQDSAASTCITMQQHADDLAALLDALEVPSQVHFCALSMGGYVGWQFLERHGARLKSLILCDTRAAADTPEAARGRLKLAEQVLREGPQPVVSAMLPKLLATDAPARQPEVVQAVEAMMRGTSPAGIAAALCGMAERPDVTPRLGAIDLPTLCIVGEHDVIATSAEMRRIAAAIPGGQFVEIPGAGHMAPLEAPGPFNAALSAFLAGVA